MSKLDSTARQRYIISKLQQRNCSFEEINDFLIRKSEEDHRKYDCSIRTFQRDLQEIATLFNIEIKYNRKENFYFVEEENIDDIGLRLLETYDIYKTINNFENTNKYVHFNKRKAIGGQHIQTILNAIQTKKQISIEHYNFWTEETKVFKLAPYAIKEFDNRWYLIALFDNKVLIFGLDRITEIQILKAKFIYPKDFSLNDMYGNSFGITSTLGETPEKISMITNSGKMNYFKTMPLHPTQTITVLPNKDIQIDVTLVPKHEFKMEILSHGKELKVIAPKRFANEIKADLAKTLALYN
jgi:hypothetical protein